MAGTDRRRYDQEARRPGRPEVEVFGWLFQRALTKDQAIAAATQLLARSGYRVVAAEAGTDFDGQGMPVVFEQAALPSRHWCVRFRLITPPGLWRSHTVVLVRINAKTGEAEFDAPGMADDN